MIAAYDGRYDPVTNGHLDILRRASRIFEHVVVAVFDAPSDKTLFATSQRVSMLQTCVQDMPSVSVEPFEGLLTDFVRDRSVAMWNAEPHVTVRVSRRSSQPAKAPSGPRPRLGTQGRSRG